MGFDGLANLVGLSGKRRGLARASAGRLLAVLLVGCVAMAGLFAPGAAGHGSRSTADLAVHLGGLQALESGTPAFSPSHVSLVRVEAEDQLSYTPPVLNLAGNGACTVGVGVLFRGNSVAGSSHNGFRLAVVGGVPRLVGRAESVAAPTRYKLEYVCGLPQGWRASYTMDVEVVAPGMKFAEDGLGHRELIKNQPLVVDGHHNRPIKPPELRYAEGDVTYAITPASLPAGLSFDASTGVISGTPTTVGTQQSHTITATDSKSGGSQTASFTVGISVVEGMRWAQSSLPDQTFRAGETVVIEPPELLDPVDHVFFTYDPDFSDGFIVHYSSGRIHGNSVAVAPKTTYTITAYEGWLPDGAPQQRTSFTVSIEVLDALVFGDKADEVLVAGQTVSIPALAPQNPWGAVTYAISSTPALPTGLSFDTGTGEIGGTLDAGATQARQVYTITGTDENGDSASYSFGIEVVGTLNWSGAPSSKSVGAGTPLSISPTLSNAIGTVSYSISPAASELPDGVGFNTATGAISGTPRVEFAEKSFTVTATDSASPPQTGSYTVAISVTPSSLAPRLTISGDSSVTEGDTATFTIHASPSAQGPLRVAYLLTQSEKGQFLNESQTGFGYATFSGASHDIDIATVADSTDEPDGSISMALVVTNSTSDYSRGSPRTHKVTVHDDDAPPVEADDTDDAAQGPCDEGWVAPTPVSVAVDAVPVVVTSTAADYFVLYATIPGAGDTTMEVPVSVTRGEDGTTTLSDNLAALRADKYRVEKYRVAQPADVDGDCVDDITELGDLGAYNPLNPALKISGTVGGVGIDSHEKFIATSSLHAPQWRHRTFENALIKFVIVDSLTSSPSVYFMDHSKYGTWSHHQVVQELRRLGEDDISSRSILRGAVTHYSDVLAPDGSLGVYVYHFNGRTPPIPNVGRMNQLLASALPFLENDLAFIPSKSIFEDIYNANNSGFSTRRVNILLYEDKRRVPAYVPLNQAEGFGLLRLMGSGDGDPRPHEIPIYESLPNDLPRVAGSITTVPQTPLSHVNLRAVQNGVPNAFVRDILEDGDLRALIGKHVFFSVAADGFVLREATKAEVDEHHESRRPAAAQTPERDLTVTKIAALADISFGDWDAFGVKAANMAELSKLGLPAGTVPEGFAVPFYFYDEFMKNAGLADETLFGKKKWPDADKLTLPAGTKLSAVVAQILAHPRFQADYDVQEEMLDDLRDAIKDADSPDWIIDALEAMHAKYPEGTSLRYRSSTNNEDLPAFNGAGLYDSKTQDPDETADDGIDKSIKAVWASLWNFRAFLERDYYRVDHLQTAMGVLVHPNFSDELVNGVAVSYDPVTFSSDAFYVNSQLGEDLVTNPEANSYPEELLLDSQGKATVLARSNLAEPGQLLMSEAQMAQLRDNLKAIHDRFKTLYNTQDGEDFAIEIEFKITADNTLAIKQARPWIFTAPISPKPVVSVAAGSGVTEGGDALFTVTADPAPSAPLSVDVTVSQSGDFGASAGSRTVTVPTSGTATVTVATADDDADEPDGSVSVAVDSGDGYTVSGSQGTASVVVSDDDDPPPAGCGSADVLAAEARAKHDALANTAANRKERNDWWRAWIALSGTTGTHNTPLTAAEALVLESGDARWTPFRAALECLEGTPPPVVPVVSVAAGSGVTEGANASFTVSASPAPSAPLQVSVSVAQSGDFGASTGSRTVTVPTSGTAAFTVSTTDDDADEPDGSVTVTVAGGSGYTVSTTQGSATVNVSDDDDPPPATPEISVTAGSGVTEGADASFTVSASPAPSAPLQVSVSVAQSGDFGASTGSRTVTVPTSGTAAFTVSTSDDDADEPDGSVSVTVAGGDGYTVSTTQGSATVNVADDDDPLPADLPVVSVSDASVVEGELGWLSPLEFRLTLSEPSDQNITVRYRVHLGTTSPSDHYGGSSRATIWAGRTHATIVVLVVDDTRREGEEALEIELTEAEGAAIDTDNNTAVGTITDND